MGFKTRNCNGLRITYFCGSRRFSITACFLNPLLFLRVCHKGAFLVHYCSLFTLTTTLTNFISLLSRIITYADDTVIFTTASDFDAIQSSLSEDINRLSSWFRENALISNLKKGKTEVMLFGTAKRLSLFYGRQFNLTVNGSSINSTTTYMQVQPDLAGLIHINV